MSGEIRVELLLGKEVVAADGRSAGRIEEIRTRRQGSDVVISEYLTGAYAVLERLAAWRIGRRFLALFRTWTGYRIPWDAIDLSDPSRPRLRCRIEDLATYRRESGRHRHR